MDDESIEAVERQLAGLGWPEVPSGVREHVLGDVRRELRAAGWDRRLGRAAVMLLVVGLGLNLAIAWHSNRTLQPRLAAGPTRDSLIHTAIIVAEATDAPTARRYARQFAALRGRQLSGDDAAAIDAAVEHAIPSGMAREHKG